jgi:UDP-glucose 4-epimerase
VYCSAEVARKYHVPHCWSTALSIYTITGGAGFIGSHLADALLAGGHTVRVLDDMSTGRIHNLDPRCTLIRGDVANPEVVQAALKGAEGCFHLAAIASVERGNRDWLGTHRVNQTGTITVFDTARAMGGVPVVYASSAAVYGDVGDAPARETLPPSPQTAYGADKLGSELHGRVAFHVHGVPTLGLRFFNVYGPRQDPLSPYSGVISIFARLAASGSTITVHGDGQQTRDFVYVGDVVAHLEAAMRHLRAVGGAHVLNVCTGRATSVLDMARTLSAAHGRKAALIVHAEGRAGDIRHSVGDPSAALAMLGLSAKVALQDGLDQTLASVAQTPAAAVGN